MKKVLFTMLLSFIFISGLQAQGQIKIGVTGGLINSNTDVSISTLGIDIANIDAVNETGFYIGGLVDISATDKVHIQPELQYIKAGDLNFFNVPIMLKYYVIDGLSLQAGPQLSFSSNLDEIKNSIEDIEEVIGTNTNIDDVLKSTAIDLAFGAGYDITDNFMVQARYGVALTDRYDGPAKNAIDIKTASLTVGIAYFF